MVDRRHIHQEAPGQGHVAGDARALFAERLLGDLHHDVLAGLEHLGNQLRAPGRSGVTVIAAVMPRPAAFEAAATAVAASPVGPSAAPAIAITSTAMRPLEARARTFSDARRLPRIVLARLIPRARRSRLAGKEDFLLRQRRLFRGLGG